MNDARQCATTFVAFALMSLLVLTGCNSPSTPNSGANTTPSFSQTADCPTMEAVAAEIVSELNKNCPRSYPYRHWGDQNSCEKKTIGKMLENYEGCFSEDALKQIRYMIHEMRLFIPDGKPSEDPTRQEL